MPVGEPLPSATHHQKSIEQHQRKDDPQNLSHTAGPVNDRPPDLVQNASSIQSMLKNATETGNVGPFSPKQHQALPSSSVPGHLHKPALRPRVGSRNFSQSSSHASQVPRSGGGPHESRSTRTGKNLLSPTEAIKCAFIAYKTMVFQAFNQFTLLLSFPGFSCH